MEKEKTNEKSQGLSKVLGPMHIWALGVGIVLVGEFMGWNFTVAKGGSIGSVIALWTVAMLYVMIVMMNTEMGSVMPEAGGQYTMAKYMLGPLAAFNVGLMLVLEYAMLEAADVLVVGQILESLNPNVKALPFIILSLLVLTYMNYRGVYATLTLNFVITAVAFVTIFILLFSTSFYDPQMTLINLKKMTDGLPYGYLGIIAAMQFAVWFFLGIEGGALAAEECRSTSRALPLGTMIGLSVLLIGATTTYEYERYIMRDKAFLRRFEKVDVSEPTEEMTVEILLKTLPKLEKQTGVILPYTDFIKEKIMKFIVNMTTEFKRVYEISSRYPDIALVILRQCFSNAIYEDRKTIDFKNIYDAVRTTKAVYPDVIKKELVNFKEIFKDELKAENIVIE